MAFSAKQPQSSRADKERLSTRRMLAIALLTAMGLALAAMESAIPPLLPLPGVKLGLANIVTLIAFSILSGYQVFLVVILRLILVGLVLGSFLTPTFWISCSGGLLGFIAMSLCAGRKGVSVVGMSLAGATFHNVGQLAAVLVLLGHVGILYYLPWLILCAVPMGLFTGFAARAAISALRKTGMHSRMSKR